MRHPTARAIIDWGASIAMIVVAIVIVVDRTSLRQGAGSGGSSPSSVGDAIPKEPIPMRDSATIGSRRASTVAILFVDFQCPYSRKFAADVWPRFYSDYVEPGKVLFSLHHLPLPMHRDAVDLAVGAECAGQQSKLLAMQDVLFKAPPDQFSVDRMRGLGQTLSMDLQRFDECLAASGRVAVTADVEAAAEWGVRGTPTMFIGKIDDSQRARIDVRLDGLPTLGRLARILEQRYGI